MAFGPIDFLAVEFPGNKFKGEIISGIADLVGQGIIRVLDCVIVMKDATGEVAIRELTELEPNTLRLFDPLKVHINSMITHDDLNDIAKNLPNNTSAAALLYENVWALKVKQAILDAGGQLLMQMRIPYDVVEEAAEDLAALGAPVA